jgi:hydrogenase nickel incorporation protein HypA/HybF
VHEIGLCEGVLHSVLKRAAGRPVDRVRVRVGVRHRVVPESMTQGFSLVAQGTEADGAELELVEVPARIACATCGHTGDTTDALATCPQCGGDRVDVTGGDELILESIEYAPAPRPAS